MNSIFLKISIFLILFTPLVNRATNKKPSNEFLVFLGGSYYIGDLNPTGHFNSYTKPAGGIGLRHNYNTRFATRANMFFGGIRGDDSKSTSPYLKQRNLNFKSPITELSIMGEFNFFDYRMNDLHKFVSPYSFIGISLFHFRPKGLFTNTTTNEKSWTELQPLKTEGQGKKYWLWQVSIPFGVGFKLNLSEKIDLALEWGMRKTFTDYLDDVSKTYPDPSIFNKGAGAKASDPSNLINNTDRQRGNSKNKDWYSFAGVIIGFRFGHATTYCPAFD